MGEDCYCVGACYCGEEMNSALNSMWRWVEEELEKKRN
jgi:hypothetical protein